MSWLPVAASGMMISGQSLIQPKSPGPSLPSFAPQSLIAFLLPNPQIRRSPIKKVRKSLALDIVDEDGKLMMSTMPKALSLVRGLREAVHPATPELQGLLCPREHGLCLWGPVTVGILGVGWIGIPRARLSGEGTEWGGQALLSLQSEQLCSCLCRKVYLARVVFSRTQKTMDLSPKHLLLHLLMEVTQ